MTRQHVAALVLTAFAVAPFLAGQQQQSTTVFRSSIDLIHFDVSVLDKDRHPVRGLTAADFTVLEDGKPQTIAAFSAVEVPPKAAAPSAAWMRDVSPDVQKNAPEQNPEGRLFAVLIDDALLPPDAAVLVSAKKIARGVLDRLSPLDQVAVIFSFSSRNSQSFTTDRNKIVAAIDTLQAGSASHLLGWDNTVPTGRPPATVLKPALDGDAGLRLGSLNTMKNVADALIAAPQRRKALIFISSGVTIDLAGDAPIRVNNNLVPNEDPGVQIREANHQLATEMPEVFRRMERANVTIYSVDPCGLGGLEAYILGAASGLPSLRGAPDHQPAFYNWLAPAVVPRPSDLAHHAATLDMDFLMEAAANTGGRAIVNTNDFNPGLDGLFDENASYYLIGYRKPDKAAPGSLHRVVVKVDRPGVTVRTRTGYETEPGEGASRGQPVTVRLAKAAAGPVPTSDLSLDLALAPLAVPGRPQKKEVAAVTLVLGLQQPQVKARTPQTIDLFTSVFTPDGRAVGVPIRQTASFTLVPGPGDVARYELLSQLALAPGRYQVRVAAHRATDVVSGSVYADVVVPGFSTAPLSVSGVWIEARPGPSAVPRDAFVTLIPIVPTASREFARGDQATAFFRVYQGGNSPLSSVPLSIRVIDEYDATAAQADGTIDAQRFDPSTRAADHHFMLPLITLVPGRYLLRFSLGAEKAEVRRDVIFIVR